MAHCLLLIIISLFINNFAYNTKQEKVIICGVGKNIQHALPNMIQKIERLGKSFKDYHVIIYENNSTDRTVELLQRWQRKNSKVTIISEQLTDEQLHNRTLSHALRDNAPCRMELIAYGRNVILEKALSPQFNDFNFLIMTDMDFIKGWDVKGVLSCFKVKTDWDCITANGVDRSGTYFDRYAYRDERFVLGPELTGEEFWKDLPPFSLKQNSGLRKVISAFGGVAVYRKEAIKNCRYSGWVTKDLEVLMDHLINNVMPKDHYQYQVYKNIINSNEDNLPVKFIEAVCGYDGSVTCEHSTFHASMMLQGFDKIYVNSAMMCYY